ncbi:MAG: periplasmic heavy metal sensor [Acidobacteriota bacterium]|nr:periplasmic heavy metal sensor [Blastocatellia bacterium]MDW8238150.1 periplasmic heavy metal sensor [Acidobacteriota bacterium]
MQRSIIIIVSMVALLSSSLLIAGSTPPTLAAPPQQGLKALRQQQRQERLAQREPQGELDDHLEGEPVPVQKPPIEARLPVERDLMAQGPDRIQLLRALGLSREQMQKVRRLHQRFGLRNAQLRDELEERRDAYVQALFNEPYDQKLVEQRMRQVLDKQQELMQAEAESERAFRAILTPEQIEKFRNLQARQLELRRLRREIRQKERQLNQELLNDRDRPLN